MQFSAYFFTRFVDKGIFFHRRLPDCYLAAIRLLLNTNIHATKQQSGCYTSALVMLLSGNPVLYS